MQKLDDYQFNKTNGRYDWDTILDGGIYRLVHGEDFECSLKSFNQLVRTKASRKGGRVRVNTEKGTDGGPDALVVKFEDRPAKKKVAK